MRKTAKDICLFCLFHQLHELFLFFSIRLFVIFSFKISKNNVTTFPVVWPPKEDWLQGNEGYYGNTYVFIGDIISIYTLN